MSHQKLTMLSPKGMQVDFVPGGFAALTQADICHALAGLDSLLTRIAYVCYVYTPADLDPAIGCHRAKADQLMLLIELTRFLQSRLGVTAGKAQKLAVCLLDASRMGQSCTRCNGQGEYMNSSGKWQDCGRCEASGYARQSQSALAKIAKMHHSTWQENYAKDYANALAHFSSLKAIIFAHISAKLENNVAV